MCTAKKPSPFRRSIIGNGNFGMYRKKAFIFAFYLPCPEGTEREEREKPKGNGSLCLFFPARAKSGVNTIAFVAYAAKRIGDNYEAKKKSIGCSKNNRDNNVCRYVADCRNACVRRSDAC